MCEYLKRSLEIKASAEIVAKSKKKLRNLINSLLNDKKRFLAKVLIDNERLWCIVIGRFDSHNANFDDTEEGEIFLGILDNEPISDTLKFNDLIQFQDCDVIELLMVEYPEKHQNKR